MKKVLAFLMAMLLCLSMAFAFAACASDGTGTGGTDIGADGGNGGDNGNTDDNANGGDDENTGDNGSSGNNGSGTTIAVEEIALDKPELTIEMGNAGALAPVLTPANANETLVWESSDPEIATVENGNITCVGVGSCTITVSTQDKSKSASCTVKVLGVKMTEEEWNAAFAATRAALLENGSFRYYLAGSAGDALAISYMFDGEKIYCVEQLEKIGTYYTQEGGKVYRYRSLTQNEDSDWKKELYTEKTFEELVQDLSEGVRLSVIEDYGDITSYDPETDIYSCSTFSVLFKNGKLSEFKIGNGTKTVSYAFYENFGTTKVELPEKAQDIPVTE